MKSNHNSIRQPEIEVGAAPPAPPEAFTGADRRRWRWFVAFLILLGILFAKPLLELARFAWTSELYSHILLIPFLSIYLGWAKRRTLSAVGVPSPGLAAFPLAVGVAVMVAYWIKAGHAWVPNQNDYLSITIFAFLALLTGVLLAFLGRDAVQAMAFPLALLLFAVPLPTFLMGWIEMFFQHASALASHILFRISGTPVFRQEMVFYLPGMTIEVATECSGIRSSLVLFITSLVAGRLFLKTPWKRTVLALAVIPLGILRNAIRIFTLCMLTIHFDPNTINGPLHHRGGPVFFVLSLVPFFALLWWLRRSDGAKERLKVESRESRAESRGS